MRPLNRPMFKYGGPIKEGIMDGMKEPQAINTVGSSLAPTDASGRQGYALPLLGLIPAGLQALRIAGPAALRGFKAARAFGATPGKLGFFGRAKDLARINKGIGLPMATRPESIGFRIGSFAKQNPFLTLSTPSLATSAVTGGGPLAIEAAKGVANFLVPGERFDPFRDKMPEKKEGDTTELKRVDEIGTGEGTTGGSVVDDPKKKKEIDDARIEKTKKRYYELMGIDKMKKDAAYDSLIDASRIVQEQGGDLKGAIRSGNLQSQIINAISKNLDKSADIKKQIDAAILKGEIEKDIKSADTTDKRLKEAKIKQLDRAEQNASASGQLAAVRAEKGFVPGATTAAILRKENIKYDTVIQDKLVTDFLEDNPTKTEADYIASLGIQLPDGRYVVGERLVEKKGNEVAFIV